MMVRKGMYYELTRETDGYTVYASGKGFSNYRVASGFATRSHAWTWVMTR